MPVPTRVPSSRGWAKERDRLQKKVDTAGVPVDMVPNFDDDWDNQVFDQNWDSDGLRGGRGSWDVTPVEYEGKGEPGIAHRRRVLNKGSEREIPIDYLIHHDDDGQISGILAYFPQGTPFEKPGSITVTVDPAKRRRGIGTALIDAAQQRWPDFNLDAQQFSPLGYELYRKVKRQRGTEVPNIFNARTASLREFIAARGADLYISGLVDRMVTEFDDWWKGYEPQFVEKNGFSWDDYAEITGDTAGPLGHWPHVENFLKERYPAAYRGHNMGLENAQPLLESEVAEPQSKKDEWGKKLPNAWWTKDLYETGPDAVARYGYDPKEIAATLLMLHSQTHPGRASDEEWLRADVNRIYDIYQKRLQMERNKPQPDQKVAAWKVDPDYFGALHEMGHVMDAVSGFKASETLQELLFQTYQQATGTTMTDEPGGHWIPYRKWLREGLPGRAFEGNQDYDDLNPKEAIAAAFAEHEAHPDASSDLVKAIHQHVVDHSARAGRPTNLTTFRPRSPDGHPIPRAFLDGVQHVFTKYPQSRIVDMVEPTELSEYGMSPVTEVSFGNSWDNKPVLRYDDRASMYPDLVDDTFRDMFNRGDVSSWMWEPDEVVEDAAATVRAARRLLGASDGRPLSRNVLTDELIYGLSREFTEWAKENNRSNPYDDKIKRLPPEEYKRKVPRGYKPRGPLGYWPNIEDFLLERYPASYRGLSYGFEDADPLLDLDENNSEELTQTFSWLKDMEPYETGPEAYGKYGYDPKEVAATFLLLHNNTHQGRDNWLREDQDRLIDIMRKRMKMQKDYDKRQKAAYLSARHFWRTARTGNDLYVDGLLDRLKGEFDEWTENHPNLYDTHDHPMSAHYWGKPRGYIGYWPNVEKFLLDKYPQAYRGWDEGHEQAGRYLDGGGNSGLEYETGPEAVALYGYDPKEIAAGMLMLHSITHPGRAALSEWMKADVDRIHKIYENRREMQQDFDKKNQNEQMALFEAQLQLRRAQRVIAMPAPLPAGVTFKYHPDNDSIPERWDGRKNQGSRSFLAPAVAAYLNDEPVGYIEWWPSEKYPNHLQHYRNTMATGSPGEVYYIYVTEENRRKSIATEMFDWARKNVEPALHHSDQRSDLGKKWINYEEGLGRAAAASPTEILRGWDKARTQLSSPPVIDQQCPTCSGSGQDPSYLLPAGAHRPACPSCGGKGKTVSDDAEKKVGPWANQLEEALYQEFMDWWPDSVPALTRDPATSGTRWEARPDEPIAHWLNVEDFLRSRYPESATGAEFGGEGARGVLDRNLAGDITPEWMEENGYIGTGDAITQAFLSLHNKINGRPWRDQEDRRRYYELMLRHVGPGASQPRKVAARRTAMAWQDWQDKVAGGCEGECVYNRSGGRYTVPQAGAFLNFEHVFYDDEPQLWIGDIYTHPENRQDGVAEALVRRLVEDHPGISISPGVMTGDGQKFHDRMIGKDPAARELLATTALSPDHVNETVNQLRQEFEEWWGDPNDAPFNDWKTIENFLNDNYPAAYRGLQYGMERAQPLLDQETGLYGDPMPPDEPYETGLEAFERHGYDPAEIVAGMLYLHNENHGFRSELQSGDRNRLMDIARQRHLMQQKYESRDDLVREAMHLLGWADDVVGETIFPSPEHYAHRGREAAAGDDLPRIPIDTMDDLFKEWVSKTRPINPKTGQPHTYDSAMADWISGPAAFLQSTAPGVPYERYRFNPHTRGLDDFNDLPDWVESLIALHTRHNYGTTTMYNRRKRRDQAELMARDMEKQWGLGYSIQDGKVVKTTPPVIPGPAPTPMNKEYPRGIELRRRMMQPRPPGPAMPGQPYETTPKVSLRVAAHENLRFDHRPGDDVFYTPTVTAYLGEWPVGHITWYPDDTDHPAYRGFDANPDATPGEVKYIEVDQSYRRQGIGTALYDWAKANARPDLHHSPIRTGPGGDWVRHEESRGRW